MRLFLLLAIALTFTKRARPEDLVLKISPVTTSLDIKGQAVKITAWGGVSSSPKGALTLSLTADLGDLQQNIAAVLAAQLNRSDRCGERLSVDSAAMAPSAPSAILTAKVHYERFACIKAFGREAVKRLVGGNAVIAVKLTPSAGPDGLLMASEIQKIDADGSLGELLRSGSLGDLVKDKIAGGVQSAIRKGLDPKSTLPPAVQAVASIQTARFTSSTEGRLWISVDGEVRLSAAQIQSLTGHLPAH